MKRTAVKIMENGYYETKKHLLHVFDTRRRKYAFHAGTSEQYTAWKAELREVLADLTGLNRMERCEPLPRLVESCRMEGYQSEKWLIQTEPEVWMPFYILLPGDGTNCGERPCVLALHGHGGGGKEGVAGRRDNPLIAAGIDRYHGDYGAQLAKQGFVVFCPDARGSGERREWMNQGDMEQKVLSSSCTDLNNAAISLGLTLTGMWIWDAMRLMDYITNSGRFDAKRMGCCGHSGGGLQSIWLAAMDDRIAAAVVSGYFHGYKDTLLQNNLCGCNFVPHLWETADMGDLGALIAPRALLIESGMEDRLNGERGMANVYEPFQTVTQAYALWNQTDKLVHQVFRGGHEWNGAQTGDFFRRWLRE